MTEAFNAKVIEEADKSGTRKKIVVVVEMFKTNKEIKIWGDPDDEMLVNLVADQHVHINWPKGSPPEIDACGPTAQGYESGAMISASDMNQTTRTKTAPSPSPTARSFAQRSDLTDEEKRELGKFIISYSKLFSKALEESFKIWGSDITISNEIKMKTAIFLIQSSRERFDI